MLRPSLILSALLLGPAVVAQGQAPSGALAIRNVSVVDVADNRVIPGQTVVIAGNRIAALGSAESVRPPAGARVIDGTGRYLIPGLWDMHVHITDATELVLPVLLANGVTGVRDAGGDLALLRGLEQQRRDGTRLGPRMVIPGPYIDSDKGVPHRLVVATAEEGRAAADSLARAGVDFIKIHNGVPRAAYLALVARARELGIAVVGHIPLEVAPEDAARAGQSSVEHFVSLFEGPLNQRLGGNPEAMRAYVNSGLDTLMSAFATNGVWLTPTAYTYWIRAQRGRLAARPDDRLKYVPRSLRAQWDNYFPLRPQDSVAAVVTAREAFYQLGLDVIKVAHRAGVGLLAGTDLAARDMLPGFHLHDELAAMVAAGLSPHEALQAATTNPARFLNRTTDLGAVAVGRLADLVLLDGNPLLDIRQTARIRAVVADGRLYDRAALDAMLAEAERKVREQG